MDHRQIVISAFDRHCEITGLAPATVSTQVVADGKFYDRVKRGGGFTTKTFERVMQWFKEHTPTEKLNSVNKQHKDKNGQRQAPTAI